MFFFLISKTFLEFELDMLVLRFELWISDDMGKIVIIKALLLMVIWSWK